MYLVIYLFIYFIFESFNFLCDLPTRVTSCSFEGGPAGERWDYANDPVTEVKHSKSAKMVQILVAVFKDTVSFKAVHVEAQSHEVAELNWFLFKQCWRINSAGKATADSSPRWHNTVCSNSVRPDRLHTVKWNGFFLWLWSPKFHKLCPGGFNVTSLKDKQTEELLVSLLWLCFLLSVWLWLWLAPNTRL